MNRSHLNGAIPPGDLGGGFLIMQDIRGTFRAIMACLPILKRSNLANTCAIVLGTPYLQQWHSGRQGVSEFIWVIYPCKDCGLFSNVRYLIV
jgi:hypothetical protein